MQNSMHQAAQFVRDTLTTAHVLLFVVSCVFGVVAVDCNQATATAAAAAVT